MSKTFECRLCPEGKHHEAGNLADAKNHLKSHLGTDYTDELDKAVNTIPGKRINYMHIDYTDGGWMTAKSSEFYLPDGRAWVQLHTSHTESKYSGTK